MGDDDLVAGVERGGERQVERLGDADGDQYLAGRVIGLAIHPVQVLGEGAAEFYEARVGGIVGLSLLQRLYARLHDGLGGVEIGLSDAQADHVIHRRRDVEEATDAGRRDGGDTIRYEAANGVH